ncbi:MAG TPA: PIG-L deacetylase family protein [Candidatus Lokiarchaeia archaeon]|nr:PIG-L deacetylase family protein [Candidatus Lokiarchaeia archaeon]
MERLSGRNYIILGKIPAGTRVLCLGAHPDDFEGGCVNTIVNLVKSGADITFCFTTGGEYGLPKKYTRFYGKWLRHIRAHEMRDAIRAYGLNSDGTPKIALEWLGFIDGFVKANEVVIRKIQDLILRVQPELIILPDPYLPIDHHSDHLRTGYACLKALRELAHESRPKIALGLFTRQADIFVPYKRHTDAFDMCRIHRSQFGVYALGWGWELVAKLLHFFTWVCHLNNWRKCGHTAEGFRLLVPPYTSPTMPTKLWHRIKRTMTKVAMTPSLEGRYDPLPEVLGLDRGY